MWSAMDVALDQVRRQARGLAISALREKVAEASVRERESAEELRRGSFSAFGDPERMAAVWTAKHAEWRRVRDLVEAAGWEVYDPQRDAQGTELERERRKRREVSTLAARAAFNVFRREGVDGLRAKLWLSAACGRRVRAVAERNGLLPEEILAQVVERVVVSEDGAVSVPSFTPTSPIIDTV